MTPLVRGKKIVKNVVVSSPAERNLGRESGGNVLSKARARFPRKSDGFKGGKSSTARRLLTRGSQTPKNTQLSRISPNNAAIWANQFLYGDTIV